MVYRREIDGLRALAVLPVILFHAGIESFSGGFVGVDVFFVISGYLITTIILVELRQGTFSLASFYERRARRILPALFLVMLVSFFFAWFWLLPDDMRDFAESLFAVPLFLSNYLFLSEKGYFETAAELKPLLHTWSLAVEEQYYAVFPVGLMLFWRLGQRWLLGLLALVFVASLALAQWGVETNPNAAFFLLPSRGWELLLGAFAAFYLAGAERKEFDRRWAEVGGWLGVAMLLYAVFTYSKSTPFPGLHALVPTVGAVLIILFATQQTTAGRFLGNRAFVALGLISYSAYLWHQPLFALARHRSLVEPPASVFLGLSVLSLILAGLSWRYVEVPFRQRDRVSRAQIFRGAVIGSAFFVALGLAGHLTDGVYIERASTEEVLDINRRFAINRGLSDECDGGLRESPKCATAEQPEVLLWGDSYAMHLAQGLVASYPDIRLIQKTVSDCGPFLGLAPVHGMYTRSWAERCIAINDRVFDYLKRTSSIKYVVMSSPFAQYLDKGAEVLTAQGDIVSGQKMALSAMASTIGRIRQLGKTPVIFSPTPQNGKNIGGCLKRASFFDGNKSDCDVWLSESHARQSEVWTFLKSVERFAVVVWLPDFLCAAELCRTSYGDVLIYKDRGHLSREGSAYLGREMDFYGRIRQSADLAWRWPE